MKEDYNKIERMISTKNYEEAIKNLEELLIEDPTNLVALSYIGIAFTENGENDKAFKALNYYLTLDEGNPDVYEALACAYFRTEDLINAKIYFFKALELFPQSPSVLRNLGIVYMNLNEGNEGLKLLKKSAEINPYDYKTMYALSSALIHETKYKEAKKILNDLLGQNIPEDYEVLVKASIFKIDNYA